MFRGPSTRPAAVALAGLALVLASGPARAAEPAEGAKSPVTVATVSVTPDSPGADTLCKLRVTLKNAGAKAVSAFGFQVKINGKALPVYDKQRYLDPIDPGDSQEIPLFNFWTSETGRPYPADGSVTVEVSLTEARYVEKRMEGDMPVWTLKDPVEGLPSTQTVRKPFKSVSKG
jgi:hypothetical protein